MGPATTPHTERILEAVRLVERTFTTHRRHREGSVRRSCLAFIDLLRQRGYTQLPLEGAQDLFSHVMDKWDFKTIKAYFGVQEHTSEKVIDRTARYASGTISFKKIQLRQKVAGKQGYLERLGLVDYEQRGARWFLIVNESSLVPELGRMGTSVREASQQSITNLSLTPKHFGESIATEQPNVETIDERQKRESVLEPEIKSLERIQNCIQLSPSEQAILSAAPCKDKPLPKIVWPTQRFKPRFEEEQRLPSQVKGEGHRSFSLRGSRVQIPPAASQEGK